MTTTTQTRSLRSLLRATFEVHDYEGREGWTLLSRNPQTGETAEVETGIADKRIAIRKGEALTAPLKRGEQAVTTGPNGGETVTIVRGEWLDHPSYTDRDGIVPARRERWVHVRFADGGRLLAHPSNLVRIP